MGYATGQFGKNHLGDLNEYLPTLHGFDEFFGYLYHLDAMEDPGASRTTRRSSKTRSARATCCIPGRRIRDDPTVDPRWGKVGKQQIEDAGTLYPKAHGDRRRRDPRRTPSSSSTGAKAAGKPFFLWLNPTRMHVVTHLSEKYEKMRTPENGWSIHEAGMAQLDDIVGARDEEARGPRASRKTRSSSSPPTTAPRTSHGPTAVRRRSRAAREPCWKAASAFPCIVRWPGQGPGGQGRERHLLRSRLVPDVRRRCRQSEHRRRLEPRARSSATQPTKCISTATIKWS